MKRLDEIKRGLENRNKRLNRLKSINAPDVILQNESKMIEELTQELSKQPEEIARKRKEKLNKLNKTDEKTT